MVGPNPYAPPQAAVGAPPQPAGPTDAEPAGFGIRAVGRLIDMVVSFAVSFAGGLAGAALLAAARAAGVTLGFWAQGSPFGILAIAVLLSTAGSLGYHVLSEGLGGASIGKLVLGLRVRSVDLTPCKLPGALIRSAAYYLDGFFFGLVAYDAMSKSSMLQRYGDRWGGTVVVKAASLPDEPGAGARLALGLGCGIACSMVAAIANVVVRAVM